MEGVLFERVGARARAGGVGCYSGLRGEEVVGGEPVVVYELQDVLVSVCLRRLVGWNLLC